MFRTTHRTVLRIITIKEIRAYMKKLFALVCILVACSPSAKDANQVSLTLGEVCDNTDMELCTQFDRCFFTPIVQCKEVMDAFCCHDYYCDLKTYTTKNSMLACRQELKQASCEQIGYIFLDITNPLRKPIGIKHWALPNTCVGITNTK